MVRDGERVERIKSGLAAAGLDAVVCALPAHTLMLSGYWPVMGTALAVATRHGEIAVVAPEDERELAQGGWADAVHTFPRSSVDGAQGAAGAPAAALEEAARALHLGQARVGYEAGPVFTSVAQSAVYLYGAGMVGLLHRALPAATLEPADEALARLRMLKTPSEVDRIRTACRIAAAAFREGANRLRPGQRETEAAAAFEASLAARNSACNGVQRCGGLVSCLSGPNAVEAFGPYARSRSKVIELNEAVLVHCASYADGYWTDITRTYCIGAPGERERQMVAAVLDARSAALGAIRPGVPASAVDEAARGVLAALGYETDHPHPTGHGVGFGAVDHGDFPRVHRNSLDILEAGMVLTLEPSVIVEHHAGVRHGDVVVVTEAGAEVLSAFQTEMREMLL